MSKGLNDSNFPMKRRSPVASLLAVAAIGLAGVVMFLLWLFLFCRVEVPSKKIAVLVKKTGADLANDTEIVSEADFDKFKGIQEKVLSEGRFFYNPWKWDWQIVDQVEIPENRLGVRIRLYGEDLGYGNLIADTPQQKGIFAEVLRPGRYPINGIVYEAGAQPEIDRDNFIELIELHRPIEIPAGFKGVVTLLSAPLADNPNELIVAEGRRGVQVKTLDAGVYFINPYVARVSLVDCRSQRFNLSADGEMGFPSRDGFWVELDGRIEFRVDPARAAEVFVTYNEATNDINNNAVVEEEIIQKVVLPNARSFCRLRGSDNSGRDFILGDKRLQFQEDFQAAMEKTCKVQGIEIIQALITRIAPPQQIAEPVRQRQIAVQQAQQYVKQIEQQLSEQELKIEQELVKQKQVLVAAEQEVVKMTTESQQKQEVDVIEANQRKEVAEIELAAAADQAQAITARGEAASEVIKFKNEAEAAGWAKSVEAYDGDGDEYARWVMLKKMAPAFQEMMVNTSDSPIMNFFNEFNSQPKSTKPPVIEPASNTKAKPTQVNQTKSNQGEQE
jgi:regulator of protease activity HflC (stomatin/prohibitin superfamily)